MFSKFQLICVLALLGISVAQLPEKSWWQTASFYQIYPRSFQDSNGDGVGDIKGVTQRLAYLNEIGITATWLSPIMTSPMADFGYDISDFYGIDPIFGTMADFEEMVAEAKKLGLKIIMDFVPNHSSDECEWFIKSAARDPEYDDWYIWHPGKMVDGVRQPPSNWESAFGGTAWEWHETRQEYYLHQFVAKQPDLNFRNPKVVEEMKNVLRFWVRKGVSGFRIDSVNYLYEVDVDEEGNYPDEPRIQLTGKLNHIYTQSQPEGYELSYEFRDVLEELKIELNSDDLVLMLESYADLALNMLYISNGTREGGHFPFNFELINKIEMNSNAYDYENVIQTWFEVLPENRTSNWVIGNHDQNRVGSRLGEQRIDLMNILVSTLPGCVMTYNGEEIGMTDVPISFEEGVDPQACSKPPTAFESSTRDPERTPMQWNEEKYAGFSSAIPWLPVSSSYGTVNVKVQRGIPRSHLNIYKQLKTLRRQKTLIYGEWDVKAVNENVLVVKRFLDGYPTLITLLNINKHMETINVSELYPEVKGNLEYLLVTDRCSRRLRDTVRAESVRLLPYEATVLRSLV